jgi:hypothetical protein
LIAIVLPAIFWLLISLALQLDIAYAGLLTPFWVSVGLICLALYDPVYPTQFRSASEVIIRRDLESGIGNDQNVEFRGNAD